MARFLLIGLLCFCATISMGYTKLVIPNDIPAEGQYYNEIRIYDELPSEDFVGLNNLEVDYLKLYNTSFANFEDSLSSDIDCYNESVLNFNNSHALSINFFDQSTVNFEGLWAGDLTGYNQSTINYYSGQVVTLLLHEISLGNVYDGTIDAIGIYDESALNIHGGQINLLITHNNSTANIYGYGFYFHDKVLTGFWENGTPFSMQYGGLKSNMNLITVPEPATLLLFGLGGVVLRRRRFGG